MTVGTADRRGSVRVAAAYPAVVADKRGRILGRGRTCNTSETGVFVIVRRREGPPETDEVVLDLTLPSTYPNGRRTRSVAYLCRIVRTQVLGHLVGLGLQFIEKLR